MTSAAFTETAPATRWIAELTVDGVRHNVVLRTAFDGIEYVGKLGFSGTGSTEAPLYDYGAIPGGTPGEVVAAALRFDETDLIKRFRRAHADKRRFRPLRRAVDEILAKVKYMNRLAISMRGGTLEVREAGQELELVTEQIQAIVSRLKDVAA